MCKAGCATTAARGPAPATTRPRSTISRSRVPWPTTTGPRPTAIRPCFLRRRGRASGRNRGPSRRTTGGRRPPHCRPRTATASPRRGDARLYAQRRRCTSQGADIRCGWSQPLRVPPLRRSLARSASVRRPARAGQRLPPASRHPLERQTTLFVPLPARWALARPLPSDSRFPRAAALCQQPCRCDGHQASPRRARRRGGVRMVQVLHS